LVERLSASPLSFGGHSIPVGVAYGVYEFKPGEDARQAMASADQAMFARKRTMKKKV
jgi:GGDEF domain-containing protein